MKEISVLSLNLRFGLADDGPNGWEYRKESIAKLFQRRRPDFIATQEANSFQVDFLADNLSDYGYIGRRRPAPRFWQDNVLFYRKPIVCKAYVHFFLSETPHVPSRSFGSRFPRQGTLGFFHVDGRSLVCIDTHLDFETPAQMGAARVIKEKLALYPEDTAAVLMGKGDPIRTPDGISGKKVGADAYRQDLVNYLGGAPVFTIPPFMYEQLQTGVIDVTTVAWMAAADWQLQELIDYVYDLSFGGGQLPCVINTSVWDKISPADQQLVMEAAAAAEQVNRDLLATQRPEARQLWEDTGIPTFTPTADELALWAEVFSVIWDEYLEMNKDVSDIDAIFNHWKGAIQDANAGMFHQSK